MHSITLCFVETQASFRVVVLCQRVAVPQVVVNPGSDNGKSGSRPGSLGMRTISPLAKTLNEEEHGAECGDAGGEETGASARESAPTDPRAHERVVNVSNETARWIFTNQPEPEDMITMQVSYTWWPGPVPPPRNLKA